MRRFLPECGRPCPRLTRYASAMGFGSDRTPCDADDSQRRATGTVLKASAIAIGVASILLLPLLLTGALASTPSYLVKVSQSPTPDEIALVSCVETQGKRYCDRLADNLSRRKSLTVEQRKGAEALESKVIAALPRAQTGKSSCSISGACTVTMSPPSKSAIQQGLTAAGFKESVIREARSDDPAPEGSVLVVVGTPNACILIFLQAGEVVSTAAGRMSDGDCI
jgi:hypothetical protein